MQSIEIKQEPEVSDGPENDIYIYEKCPIKLELNTYNGYDDLQPKIFNEDVFHCLNNSISIKDEVINEKFITLDSLNGSEQNVINTFNTNGTPDERIINENITSSQNNIFIFMNQRDFLIDDDKTILKPFTTIIKSDKQLQSYDENSIKQNCTYNELDVTSNGCKKRKLIETSPNYSTDLPGVSPKRRKINKSKRHLLNNNRKNFIIKFNDSSKLITREKIKYYPRLDHVKTSADLTKLLNVRVILERINVKDYLENQNIEKFKNFEDLNNIQNKTKFNLTSIPNDTLIKTKGNDESKTENKINKKIKTKLDKNIDFSSLIIINCKECNEMYKSTEKIIKQCQKCKAKLTYICRVCEVRCKTYDSITKHAKFTCKGTDYSYHCVDCTYKSRYKKSVKNHILEKHMGQTLPRHKCHKCSLTYKEKYTLQRHQKTCGLPPHLFCTFCPYNTIRRDVLVTHMKKVHTDKFKLDEELKNIIKIIDEKGQQIRRNIDDSNKAIEIGMQTVVKPIKIHSY